MEFIKAFVSGTEQVTAATCIAAVLLALPRLCCGAAGGLLAGQSRALRASHTAPDPSRLGSCWPWASP